MSQRKGMGVREAIDNGSRFENVNELFTGSRDLRWYAAYTLSNHEKRVALQFTERSVEHFLPMYESVRRWSDRQIKAQRPLFPGYLFVRLALCDRLQVLRVPGVARLVGFNGAPTPLPEYEIEGLRRALVEGLNPEPHRYLKTGRRVRITRGPLSGREGILRHWKGDLRVVLSIEIIQRAISVEIDSSSIIPLHHFRRFCMSAS